MTIFLLWLLAISLAARSIRCENSTWCGKAYKKESPAIPPGGSFEYPIAKPYRMLHIKLQPRYTIFLENDSVIELVLEVIPSHLFGTPMTNQDVLVKNPRRESENLIFELRCDELGVKFNHGLVGIGTTKNTITIEPKLFTSRLEPYQITLEGRLSNSQQKFNTSTEIYFLPRRDYGSAVKIDKLYGGSYVQNSANHYQGWYPVFPHGMFTDARAVIPSITNHTPLEIYSSFGFNMMIIVPDGGAPEQSYNYSELLANWNRMDEMNIFNIYSLQFAYQNQTRIDSQVKISRNRNSLYSYHIADEPDGWHHPVENTRKAYELIKKLDPYHPIQLVLNCQNFYYDEYAGGADIVLEDVYPIGTDPYHSVLWDTPCNTTYGDCGCDNGHGVVTDVSDRLDSLYSYQANLEKSEGKFMWATIQAFEMQDYWLRQPSSNEVVNMVMLALNHDAKGITYWLYTNPNSTDLVGIKSIASVLRRPYIIKFLFGTMAIKRLPYSGATNIDVSAWVVGNQMMVGIAAVSSSFDPDTLVTITIPHAANSILQQVFGNTNFTLSENNLSATGMTAMEVNILVLNLK